MVRMVVVMSSFCSSSPLPSEHLHGAGGGDALFIRVEIVFAHVRHVRFGGRAPLAHGVRVLLRVRLQCGTTPDEDTGEITHLVIHLDGGRRAAVRVALSQHRVDGRTHHLAKSSRFG